MPNRQKRKAEEKRGRDPRPTATSHTLRMSATKVRRVSNLVKGLPVAQALSTCDFLPHRAAADVKKTLQAALANADNNCDLDPDDLVVTDVQVNETFTIPRIRPRAQGRAYRIRRRTCRLTITVGEREEE
jgi:large subunit ribosomal protein L22